MNEPSKRFLKYPLILLTCLAAFGCFLFPRTCVKPIIIFGDSQVNSIAQERIVRLAAQFKPAIVFRVGDLTNDGRDVKSWEAFLRISKPLLSGAEYFPCLGNHEHNSPLYFQSFPSLNGQRWYSIRRQGIHFVVLDSNADLRPGSAQYSWLEADLKAAGGKSKNIIVFLHHPIFNVGRHAEEPDRLGSFLLPLFKKYGVSAVFSGHDHNYQRFWREGIYYIVTGGGGAPLYNQTRSSPYLAKFIKMYHICLLIPGKNNIEVRVINAEGRIIDFFTTPNYGKNA